MREFLPSPDRVLVKKEEVKDEPTSRFKVEENEPYFATGTVVNGPRVGQVVVFPVEKEHKLGLKFPKEYVVVAIEDIFGVINIDE